MRRCRTCGHPNSDGAIYCQCGALLIAEPDGQTDRAADPVLTSPSKPDRPPQPFRVWRQGSESPSPPRKGKQRSWGNWWVYWLVSILVVSASRVCLSRSSPPGQPLYVSSSGPDQKRYSSGFPQSSTGGQSRTPAPAQAFRLQGPASTLPGPSARYSNGLPDELRAALDRLPADERERCERLQLEAREILLKHLTAEEYEFLYEKYPRSNRSFLTKEEVARAESLTRRVDSRLAAEEKKKVADAAEMYRRLVDTPK